MGTSAGALSSLLLGMMLTYTPGALGANPGLVARITDKGLEYVAQEELVTLQSKLYDITLPDFSGDVKIKYIGNVHYEFHSLDIHSCELLGSALKPLPSHGLHFSISDSFIRVKGKWKVRKRILKLDGSFDVKVKGITISVNLLLGSEPSGRPKVAVSSCSSPIHDVEVHMSGDLGWLLNLFHHQIESKFRRVLESKICKIIQDSVTSDLQPYLQTLPVTMEMDIFAGIDYSLMEAPQATAEILDVMLKGEIFSRDHRSPVAFLAPVMSLPEEHSRMVYFAISNYAFNTASLVYHKVGYLNFSITDDMVPPTSNIRLTTKSFRAFFPRATNVSVMLTFNASKITGFLKPAKMQVELKESKVGVFNVELLEALLNYYLLNTLYPKVNDKLAEGFPLPLLKRIQLYDPVLQIHKDFLFLGTNVRYLRV
eukprot:bmy_15746T0